MPRFKVEITEEVYYAITVEAVDATAAEDMAREEHEAGLSHETDSTVTNVVVS